MKLFWRVLLALLVVLLVWFGYFWVSNWRAFKRFETLVHTMQKKHVPFVLKTSVQAKKLKMRDHSIHYFVSGHGKETLLMLHPAYGDHQSFERQLDFFSKHYKIITVDLLGHGRSQVRKTGADISWTSRHLKRILALEKVNKAHVIGVSLGSLLAQHFALRFPEKVQSLTVVGGYRISGNNEEILQRQQREIARWLLMMATMPLKVMKSQLAQMTCYHKRAQIRFYELQKPWDRDLFSLMKGFGEIIKKRPSATMKHPTLLVVGEHDLAITKKANRQWKKQFPKTRLLFLKNSGHCANMDTPKLFNQSLLRFLQDTTAPKGKKTKAE